MIVTQVFFVVDFYM